MKTRMNIVFVAILSITAVGSLLIAGYGGEELETSETSFDSSTGTSGSVSVEAYVEGFDFQELRRSMQYVYPASFQGLENEVVQEFIEKRPFVRQTVNRLVEKENEWSGVDAPFTQEFFKNLSSLDALLFLKVLHMNMGISFDTEYRKQLDVHHYQDMLKKFEAKQSLRKLKQWYEQAEFGTVFSPEQHVFIQEAVRVLSLKFEEIIPDDFAPIPEFDITTIIESPGQIQDVFEQLRGQLKHFDYRSSFALFKIEQALRVLLKANPEEVKKYMTIDFLEYLLDIGEHVYTVGMTEGATQQNTRNAMKVINPLKNVIQAFLPKKVFLPRLWEELRHIQPVKNLDAIDRVSVDANREMPAKMSRFFYRKEKKHVESVFDRRESNLKNKLREQIH